MADLTVSKVADQLRKKYAQVPPIINIINGCEASNPKDAKAFMTCAITKLKAYFQQVKADFEEMLAEMKKPLGEHDPSGPGGRS